MCSYVRECAPALNICDTGSIHVLLACHGESKVCRLCPEQQSAAASTSEVVVLLCCWAWAKEQKHIILGCIYGDKRQLRCLVWCNFQLSLACSNIQLREMWWRATVYFLAGLAKCCSALEMCLSQVLVSIEWLLRMPSSLRKAQLTAVRLTSSGSSLCSFAPSLQDQLSLTREDWSLPVCPKSVCADGIWNMKRVSTLQIMQSVCSLVTFPFLPPKCVAWKDAGMWMVKALLLCMGGLCMQ